MELRRISDRLEEERRARQAEAEASEAGSAEERIRQEHAIRQLQGELAAQRESFACLRRTALRVLRLLGAFVLVAIAVSGTVVPISFGAVSGALPVALVISGGFMLVVAGSRWR